METPPVILFDAAETLMFLPRSVGEHYAAVAAHVGVTANAGTLDRAFRRAWKAMPARNVTPDGGPQPDDDKGWWRDLVRLAANEALPRDLDFDAYFEAVYAHFAEPGVWQAFPEVEHVLEALAARGARLGVVSNFDRRLHSTLADLGLAECFAHVVLSSEVGADKPHPRIFERACALFGVARADALHVGDDPVRDWRGAESAGLRIFRLSRPENDLRALL